MDKRLKRQLEFIVEIDKIKSIFRKTKLFDGSRLENDAEHSWHFAVMASVLAEHSNARIDIAKVIKMALIHDIPEVYAGDTMIYIKGAETEKKEEEAAKKVFSMLPRGQGKEYYKLWREFEDRKTPEAKFASALDRLEPVMQNYFNKGEAWKKNRIPAKKIYAVNSRIGDGSDKLWKYAQGIIKEIMGNNRPDKS